MANYRSMAAQAARQYGLPVNIFLRQINQESGFNPRAGSSAGAQGIAQFMPATARAHGVNPWDPHSALFGAAKMMSESVRQYGSMERALSAYNSGRPDKYLDPNFAHGQTYNYVRTIMNGRNIPGAGNVRTQPAHTQAGVPSVARTQTPAESPHRWSDFAMGLLQSFQSHSPEAMMGAIMQLRNAAEKPQPVSFAPGVQGPVGRPRAGPTGPMGPAMGPGNPLGEMLAAQKLAKKMGMRESENFDLPGGVNPVHVKGSYHYQRYKSGKVGRATDISGTPAQMAALYRALAKTNPTELFYDPLGGIKYGKQIGAIGGHRDHVHVAY